jgi:hypothetical protein
MPLDETADGPDVIADIPQKATVRRSGPVAGTGYRNVTVVLGWWGLLFAASVVLYWPGLRAGYFSDDLLFFFYSPPAHLYDYFARTGAAAQAYRPLEAIILTLIQHHFWFNTLPIHLISLAAHAGLACAVLIAARRFALRAAEAFLACGFMLVAQVGAPGVLGNDTLSQVVSTLLGGLGALFLCFACFEQRKASGHGVSRKWLGLSVASDATSLFFKETALGFLLVVMVIIAAIARREDAWITRIKRAFALAIPYGAATLVYGLARLHAGGAISQSGSYRIHVGMNILRNLAEFSFAAFGPVSTVDGAVSVAMRQTPALVLEASGWILILGLLAGGIYISGRRQLCLWLGIAGVASLFPAYLLTHISELYLYNAIPFLALVFGIAFGTLWYEGTWKRAVAVVGTCVLIGGQIYADREKAALMALNGKRAGAIMAGIEQYLHTLPPDSQILLVNPPSRKAKYSVFLLNGFDVVDLGNLRIGPIFGRPDVRVEVVQESSVQGTEQRKNRLLLSLDANGGVRPY